MSRFKKFGNCSICGFYSKLSFEHVPPKAAFNKGKLMIIKGTDSISKHFDEPIKGPIQQGGAGFYSICEKCNNSTGSWYGNAFVSFAAQAQRNLVNSGFKPFLHLPFYILPLRVIKQIITMFFTLNMNWDFRKSYPELVKFVLDKESRFLDDKYKVYVYYNYEGIRRYNGWAMLGDLSGNRDHIHISELSFPPLGYVLTMANSPKPHKDLFDITFFSEYRYNDFKEFHLKLYTLSTHLGVPGDYRSYSEIRNAIDSNRENRMTE